MKRKKMSIQWLIIVLLLILILNPTTGLSKPAGKMVIAVPSEPMTIDPHKVATRYSHTFNCALFEALYVRNSKAELVPGLAKSVDISKDGLTYTFMIRTGVRFHDGTPLTTEDIKFSLERAINPETKDPMAAYLKSISSVDIGGGNTIILKLKSPDAILLKKLAYAGWVIPKGYFLKVGEEGFGKHPIGSGPFKFEGRSINEYIKLEANEDHWRWVPKIKSLIYKVIPEAAVRMGALQTGDADIVTELPPALFEKVDGIKGCSALSHPSGAIYWVVINVKDSPKESPLKNRQVREALNYAVNKEGIIGGVLKGQAIQIPGVLAPSVIKPESSLKPYEYDPDRAKRLLAETGYPNGFKTEMYSPVGRYTLGKEISLVIAENLKAVGVDVDLKLWESMRWVTDLKKHYYPLSYQEFGNTIFDPEGLMIWALHTKAFWSYYTNPKVDKLIEESTTVYGQEEREKHFRKIDKVLHDDASHIFLYELKVVMGKNDKLHWNPAPGDMWFKFWDAYWE
jgi:peptide/nickel transport system substrate-binding protein